jgi:hypothetical protein
MLMQVLRNGGAAERRGGRTEAGSKTMRASAAPLVEAGAAINLYEKREAWGRETVARPRDHVLSLRN